MTKLVVHKVFKETPNLTYVHNGDSGFDLYAAESVTVRPNHRTLISVGIKVIVSPGYEMQIRPRSGLATKKGLTVLNSPGTIDSNYRGVVKVLLINLGGEAIQIAIGDRIAQAVICPVETAIFSYVSEEEYNKEESTRGSGGFGSTGISKTPETIEKVRPRTAFDLGKS